MPIHILSLLHIAMVLVVAYHRSASCDLWLDCSSFIFIASVALCMVLYGGGRSVQRD